MRKVIKDTYDFNIRPLSTKDAEDSYNLLDKVIKEMQAEGNSYLLHKSLNKIKSILADSGNEMIGVFVKNGNKEELIAQMGSFGVSPQREDGEDMFPSDFSMDDISFIGSVCVDANFRGVGLLQKMYDFWELNTKKKRFLVAVNEKNYQSFGFFLKKGFCLTKKVVDPLDMASILYFFKDLDWSISFDKADASVFVNYPGYSTELENLLCSGYVGYDFKKKDKSILLAKNNSVLEYFGCFNVEKALSNYVKNKTKSKQS